MIRLLDTRRVITSRAINLPNNPPIYKSAITCLSYITGKAHCRCQLAPTKYPTKRQILAS